VLADRQSLGKITADGVFIEQLETDPARYLPEITEDHLEGEEVVQVDLTRPMAEIRQTLSQLSREDALDVERPDGRRPVTSRTPSSRNGSTPATAFRST
jgi:fumarate hydratase class I